MTNESVRYTPTEIAKRFGVTTETVRQWTIRISRWLSTDANPHDSKKRRYSFDDLGALTLVWECRKHNEAWEDIEARLSSGERGVPAIDPAALIPLESQKQLFTLYQMIERFKAEKADLEARLMEQTTRADRAEGALNEVNRRLSEAEAKIDRLNREIGKLERDT